METRILNVNSIEYVIASTYATGKGRLFEMFFGWRCTKGENAKIVLSKKGWAEVDEMIDYYKKFVEKPLTN